MTMHSQATMPGHVGLILATHLPKFQFITFLLSPRCGWLLVSDHVSLSEFWVQQLDLMLQG